MTALERIDRAVLGLSRAKHHRFSASDHSVSGFILRDANDSPVGYVYVSKDGHIGPLAVMARELVGPALCTAIAISIEQEGENVSAFLPGVWDDGLKIGLDARLRLGRTMVLMSSKPFGDWTRYAPRHPGYM
jgi:hypothetical protein